MTNKTKAIKVETWDISRLVPYEKNAKKHDPEQIERLAETIKRQGFDVPIVVWPIPGTDKGSIIKGHGRRLAALKLGMDKVIIIVRDDLTEEQADVARISDNAVSSIQYDTRMLAEETERLMKSFDFGKFDFGFNQKEADLFLKQTDTVDINSLTSNVSESVAEQKREDAVRVVEIDQERVPFKGIFGSKDVSTEQARILSLWFESVKMKTGLEGVEALTKWAGETM